MTLSSDLPAEDEKIVTLARAALQRAYAPYTGSGEGAAVRDVDGRTYAAATVEHPDPRLTTSALRGAVVAAASSGARALEAAAVVTHAMSVTPDDAALVREFGRGLFVYVADANGLVIDAVIV